MPLDFSKKKRQEKKQDNGCYVNPELPVSTVGDNKVMSLVQKKISLAHFSENY